MKLLKLNSIINIYTSITWNIETNDFFIFTDWEEWLDFVSYTLHVRTL